MRFRYFKKRLKTLIELTNSKFCVIRRFKIEMKFFRTKLRNY